MIITGKFWEGQINIIDSHFFMNLSSLDKVVRELRWGKQIEEEKSYAELMWNHIVILFIIEFSYIKWVKKQKIE